MKEIPLTKGHVALVDDEDYWWLSKFTWFAKSGGDDGDPYAARSVRDGGKVRTVRMHRLIMATPPGMEADHIDGNRLNNQRANLQNKTKQDNLHNRRFNNGD